MNTGRLDPFFLKIVQAGQEEKVFIRYSIGDEQTECNYDSELQVRVRYKRNLLFDDCVENYLLSGSVLGEDKLNYVCRAVDIFVESLKPDEFHTPATEILIETVDGRLSFSTQQDTADYIPPFPLPEIPQLLSSIPKVSISELKRLRRLYEGVDLVVRQERKYVFKKMPDGDPQYLMREIMTLNKLKDVESVISIEALVVSGSCVRGFLTQYMERGDLDLYLQRTKPFVHWKVHGNRDIERIRIPWEKKIGWMFQIARAVLQMHELKIYNGDLKPANILLTDDEEVRIIDFCPAGPTMSWGAPEYVNAWKAYIRSKEKMQRESKGTAEPAPFDFDSALTPEADVYSLGGLFWAISEEHNEGLDNSLWKSTPKWLRRLIDRCLSDRPEHRPTVHRILRTLEHKGREVDDISQISDLDLEVS